MNLDLWERAADDIAGALASSQVRARVAIDDLYGARIAQAARDDIRVAHATFPETENGAIHPPGCLCRHRALLAVAAWRCESRTGGEVRGEDVFTDTMKLVENYLARRS